MKGIAGKILIVDDNDLNRQLLKIMLSSNDIVLHEAVNGVQAVKAVQEEEYDVILMDISMPEMDGVTATKLIRSNIIPDMPIVKVSAYILKEDYDYLFDDILYKPVDYEELKKVIKKHLQVKL